MRKWTAELEVSRESVHRVVKGDLGLSNLKLRTIQSLTNSSKEKRMKRCHSLIRRLAGHGLDSVVFTDERFSPLNKPSTVKITVFLPRVSQKPLKTLVLSVGVKPASVMAWAIVCKGGGWVYHFFIYLFIWRSNRTAALFLCYHSTTLCTFKDNISASAICYLWRFIY